ncbi:MAG: ActS/PrrB/RegB family redox-sensitive histidine kinase [Alphaproteobacteria bacterium]|nr:ActS/PrrB/RegB family redox-sensitive histidine kinase [Alphaproteobacteria bacterium]
MRPCGWFFLRIPDRKGAESRGDKQVSAEIVSSDTKPLAGQWRPVRLATLLRLRWLGIAGQSVAILVVAFGLGFSLPLWPAAGLVVAAAALNIGLVWRFGLGYRLTASSAAMLLVFDCMQLAGLLWLTGGLENPFAILMLAPVSVSATTLSPRATVIVAAVACALATALTLSHMPLPWRAGEPIYLDPLYVMGLWIALLLGVSFVAAYTNRTAHEARQLADALSVTELALSRQQQLRALDGLAAAAAHELGTPLSTIALVAKERRVELEPGEIQEDFDLILEQVVRCRAILGKLRNLGQEKDPFASVRFDELIAEVAQPYEKLGKLILLESQPYAGKEPIFVRNVGLIYGLGNLVENAVNFAAGTVSIISAWDDKSIRLTISDDGPGFPLDVLDRLGEPYLTTRPHTGQTDPDRPGGLGLGVFIAKTLIERTGARLVFANAEPDGGAEVRISWPRAALENEEA